MAHQVHSINPRGVAGTAALRAFEAEAYELRSRIGDAWDRLTADKLFDAYDRERTLEDVDRALALAFKLTDIFSGMGRGSKPAANCQRASRKHQAA